MSLRDIGRHRGFDSKDRVNDWLDLCAIHLFSKKKRKPKPLDANVRYQLTLDVQRSATQFTGIRPGTLLLTGESQRRHRRDLLHILSTVLARHELQYYQGFHDICSVVLLALGRKVHLDLVIHVTEVIALVYQREFMGKDFKWVLQLLQLLSQLVVSFDPSLRYVLFDLCNNQPTFCISWILTWFSHDLSQLPKILRLFDYFLCSHPLSTLYVCAAIIVHEKEHLFNVTDYAEVHQHFSNCVKDLDWSVILELSQKIEKSYPIPSIVKSLSLQPNSCYLIYDTHWKVIFSSKDKKEEKFLDWLALAQGHIAVIPKSAFWRTAVVETLPFVLAVTLPLALEMLSSFI